LRESRETRKSAAVLGRVGIENAPEEKTLRRKHCVVLPHGGDANAFGASLRALGKAAEFDRTLLVALIEKKPYEWEEDLFAAMETPLERNATRVCDEATAERVFPLALEHARDTVVFLEEGDEIGAHFLEYAGCFFEAAGGRCGVAAAPVAPVSPLFANVPAGGIKTLGAEDVPPFSARGTAISVSALAEAGIPVGLNAEDAFLYAVWKTVLREGRIGLLPALAYGGEARARPCVSRAPETLAEEFADENGVLPEALGRWIKAYAERWFSQPLSGCDAESSRLLRLIERTPALAEGARGTTVLPRVEITGVENLYADTKITGVLRYAAADAAPRLRVRPPAKALSFELAREEEGRCLADRLFPKVRFSAAVKPDERGVARLRFFQNGKVVRDISVPEKTGRSEPFRNHALLVRGAELSVERIAPRAFYRVSCVVPVFNGEAHLAEALESVVSQTIGFFENVQIVIVDDGSTDGTARICSEYRERHPHNVVCVSHANNSGVSAARNTGLRFATGEFVAFLDADDTLDPAMLKTGADALSRTSEVDVAAFPTRRFGSAAGSARSSSDFVFEETAVIDVEKDPRRVLFGVCAAVFRRAATEDLSFDERLRFSEDAAFMHDALLKNPKWLAVKEPAYRYRTEADGDSAMRGRARNPRFYEKCGLFGETILARSVRARGRVTEYTRHLLVHELIGALTDEAPKTPPENLDAALAGAIAPLREARDDVVEAAQAPPPWFKRFLRGLRDGKTRLARDDEGVPSFRADGEALAPRDAEIFVSALRERGGVLRVFGRYGRLAFEEAVPVAFLGGRGFVAKRAERASREVFFLGLLAYEERAFVLEIPSDAPAGGGSLSFALRTAEGDAPALPRFEGDARALDGPNAFFAGESILLTREKDAFRLRAESISNERLSELLPARFSDDERAAEARKSFEEHLRVRPLFAETRVWLFMDDTSKAGSNAERMFSYCAGLRDGIDKHFVIAKGALDGWRLFETGSVLEHGSDAHKLIYPFAEKIILSAIGDDESAAIEPEGSRAALGGFFNRETVLLPGGFLTKEDASKLRGRASSVGLLSVATETERRLALEFGGLDADVVRAAGSPAFDFLTDKNGRRILFMPAHRERLCVEEGRFDAAFATSAYREAICELLCDERLFDALEERGYAFDFAPPERVWLQISDFEMDEIVNIVPPNRARRALFEEASLLVTDCLPAFETAYMKKPVLYFRFAEEDALPDGRRFDDETTFPGGVFFGEVVEGESRLADRILSYVKNDCAASEAHVRRAEDFFAHTDKRNRERIYELLLERTR
jgi:glycosyltransferase involved in cell wall biosynthesis